MTNTQKQGDPYKRKFRIMLAASKDARLSRGALAVLAYVLDNESEGTRTVDLHQGQLAAAVGLSRPNASRALGALQEAGYVEEVTKGDRFKPGTYKARMPFLADNGTHEAVLEIAQQPAIPSTAHLRKVEIVAAAVTDNLLIMTWNYGDGAEEVVELDLESAQGHEQIQEILGAAKLAGVDDSDLLIGSRFHMDETGRLLPID